MVQEQQDREAESVPLPLATPELVDLLIGRDRPLLYYTVAPLGSWPCRLVAAIGEAAEQTAELSTCSWRRDISTGAAKIEHEITVRALGGDRLPDAFDGEVFAALVARATAQARAAGGKQGDGSLRLPDTMDALRLSADDPKSYVRVAGAIQRLSGMSISAISRVHRHNRPKGERPDERVTGFRLIPSYEFPSDRDFRRSPIWLDWNPTVYAAVVAVPEGARRTGMGVPT